MISSYIIFAICMTGCAWQCYILGRKLGIQTAVQYFIDNGILEVVDENEENTDL